MKPFAIRYRDAPASRTKLSLLRFATAAEAREYGKLLAECGACRVAVVKREGRRYVSAQSIK